MTATGAGDPMTPHPDYSFITYERVGEGGRIARITLNRPEAHNAQTVDCSSNSMRPCGPPKPMTRSRSSSFAANGKSFGGTRHGYRRRGP